MPINAVSVFKYLVLRYFKIHTIWFTNKSSKQIQYLKCIIGNYNTNVDSLQIDNMTVNTVPAFI